MMADEVTHAQMNSEATAVSKWKEGWWGTALYGSLASAYLVAKNSLFQTFEDSYVRFYSGLLWKTELVTLFLEQRADNLKAS